MTIVALSAPGSFAVEHKEGWPSSVSLNSVTPLLASPAKTVQENCQDEIGILGQPQVSAVAVMKTSIASERKLSSGWSIIKQKIIYEELFLASFSVFLQIILSKTNTMLLLKECMHFMVTQSKEALVQFTIFSFPN